MPASSLWPAPIRSSAFIIKICLPLVFCWSGILTSIKNFYLFIKTYVEALRNVTTPPDIYGQTIVTPLPGGGGVLPDIIIGDQHLTKVIPSITVNFSSTVGLQFEIIEPLNGRNALNGTTYSLGLVLHN